MKRGISMRHHITLGLLGTIACAVAIPAVVAAATPASPAAMPDPNWLRSDTASAVTYPDTTLTSRPANNVKATVDAQGALRKVDAAAFPSQLRPGTPEVALRSLTKQAPGQAKPDYTDRPTWVVTFRNSAPQVRGPITMSDEKRRELLSSLYCVMVFLVDATTADVYDAQQYCKS